MKILPTKKGLLLTVALLFFSLFTNDVFIRPAVAANPACTADVDVVFYIDTSGSMNDEWDTVCDNIDTIVSNIETEGNTINYTIYGLGTTKDCAASSIESHSENWGPGTVTVATTYPWNADAIRIAVPISDECPYQGNPCDTSDSTSITNAIAAAVANNVIVSPIISASGDPFTQGTNLANGTGGQIYSASGEDVADAIISLITNELGDKDGDGSLSPMCGGDDCDDSDSSIFPGGDCYNKCIDNVLMSGRCIADGSGECLYDTEIAICENLGDICKLDTCQEVEDGDDICVADFSDENFCGGLIPCGRMIDDPSTTDRDETAECSFCHLALLANNVMDYMIEIASTLALLAIIIAGFLYITSGENVEKRTQAKTYLSAIIKGYVAVFIAWLIVDFILSVWGYLDPLGGDWDVVCDYLYILIR